MTTGGGVAYIRRHWRGECGLARSFWLNFILLFVALTFLERLTLPPFLRDEWVVTAAVGVFVLKNLVVYPWQVVGVVRACESRIKGGAGRTLAVAAEGVVVLSAAVVLAAAFASYQSLLGHRQSLRVADAAPHTYSLELAGGGALLHLRGELTVGVTNAVAGLLADHPAVAGIVLDSGGGRIYEGRGLARVIRENNLATYSTADCVSSCTTAFVAGKKRALGDGARLGFHQYKTYSVMPPVDIADEMEKDRAVFRAQGVAPSFLDKIFVAAPEEVWWPAVGELIDAGVVHETGFILRR